MRYQMNIIWKDGRKETKIFDSRDLADEFWKNNKQEISKAEGYRHMTAIERISEIVNARG